MRVVQAIATLLVTSSTLLLSKTVNASILKPFQSIRGGSEQQQMPPVEEGRQEQQLERELFLGSTGFFMVNSQTNALTELTDQSVVTTGDFHFTFGTQNSENVASVEFKLSVTSPTGGTYPSQAGTFFDLSLAVSSTPGDYVLEAQSFDANGVSVDTSTVSFTVEESPVTPAPVTPAPVTPAPVITPAPATPAPAPPSSGFDPIRIICGRLTNYLDSLGRLWSADMMYGPGNAVFGTGKNILGTEDDAIYEDERYAEGSPSVLYDIVVDPSFDEYDVVLHFCELYFKDPDKRVFDISLEGAVVKTDQDTVEEAGGQLVPLLVSFENVTVTDGVLNIELVSNVQNAAIVAIEVLPAGSSTVPQQKTIYVNCGSASPEIDVSNQLWGMDRYNSGTGVPTGIGNVPIAGTLNDFLYQTFRIGLGTTYSIPLQEEGDYLVSLYFVEHFYDLEDQRTFSVYMEGNLAEDSIDIVKQAGAKLTALELVYPVTVLDGELNIVFGSIIGEPTISAIKVEALGPHLAHSVTGGPYSAVDVDDNNSEVITVDATEAHTHAPGASLISYVWTEGATELANTNQPVATFTLTVGEHIVNLRVEDDQGNVSDEVTTISVLPKGFPVVSAAAPNSGQVEGNTLVTISGSGLDHPASSITVTFGTETVPTSNVFVVDDSTLQVLSPPYTVAIPVDVTVTTPIGTSNSVKFTYISGNVEIAFSTGDVLAGIPGPTAVAFGPNGKLYVGTQGGAIYALTLDESYNVVTQVQSDVVVTSNPAYFYRAILGITVDPFDTREHPDVYVSHSYLFHGSTESFKGDAINGKVSKVSGALLDTYEDVVTGLPVSDHDHGINGLEFDDEQNLYIQVGGNTNAGVPGALSGSSIQEDNWFSSATVVAHLGRENFNGDIVYDQTTGYPIHGDDVEVFAAGQRNPYDLTLHSNGNLYATDNGPNLNYGQESTGCNSGAADPSEPDELNMLTQGGWYGQANRIYGQCVWKSVTEPSGGGCKLTHSASMP